jgi:hypothetical protein
MPQNQRLELIRLGTPVATEGSTFWIHIRGSITGYSGAWDRGYGIEIRDDDGLADSAVKSSNLRRFVVFESENKVWSRKSYICGEVADLPVENRQV